MLASGAIYCINSFIVLKTESKFAYGITSFLPYPSRFTDPYRFFRMDLKVFSLVTECEIDATMNRVTRHYIFPI